MKFNSFFLSLYFFAPIAGLGQVTYTWNGVISTDFQVSGNWTPSRNTLALNDILAFNAISPINIDNVANQSIGSLQITGGTNTINFTSNTSGITLTITGTLPLNYITAGSVLIGENLNIQLANTGSFTLATGMLGIAPSTGGKLTINNQLIIDGGTLVVDVPGTGGLTINAGMSITYKKGTFASNSISSISWLTGSTYFHNADGSFASSIPAASWQRGSNCVINGLNAATNTPTGLDAIFFSNFFWNCPNQFGASNLLPTNAILNIIDTFTVSNTNAKDLIFSSTGKVTLRVGTYIQNGGIVTMQSSATVDTTTLTVFGSFTQTGGTLNAVGGSSPGVAILDFRSNVTVTSPTTWSSTSSNSLAQQIIQFTGVSSQNVTFTPTPTWNSPTGGRCNIINQNSDLVNGVNLSGTLKVINTNSAAAATFTMAGVITGSGSVSYTGTTANPTTLIYGGGFFLTASTKEFPSSTGPNNLTINNLLGVSFPSSFSRTIAGTLNMVSGNLSIGTGNSLSLNNSIFNTQLSYTKGFITSGTLNRTIPASGLPTSASSSINFPFGNGDNDRKLGLYFSSSTITSGGTVGVTHVPQVNITNISLVDNGLTLNKRSNSYWTISAGINLGATTAALIASADNIGSVENIDSLRLTDATTSYGNLIAATGTVNSPIVGKSGLGITDLNKTIYIGSGAINPLIIITFNWTGNASSDWTNPLNWTSIGGIGYPNSSTENAVIISKTNFDPTINTGTAISVYQLTVGGGLRFTLTGTAGINVFDTANFTGGLTTFSPTSTFGYFSSNNPQLILDLPYGNLTLSGLASKTYSPSITVLGDYKITGFTPLAGTNTFTYAGSGSQRITATNYYNLILTGVRTSGAIIALGNSISDNIIDVRNVFSPAGLSGIYTVKASFNKFNFSDPTTTGSQIIPGFTYEVITNSNGNRTFDNLGSTSIANVINCYQMTRGTGIYTVTNSKVRFVSLGINSGLINGSTFHDIEFSGDYKGFPIDFFNGTSLNIAGRFSITATNFKLGTSGNVYRFNFNGTTDQTITAFKTDNATNTPAFKYSNVFIAGGNRNVTLGGSGTDTIFIRGKLSPECIGGGTCPFNFNSGKGFTVAGSTVEFSTASNDIPVLTPLVAGGNNYNNIVVSGGTQKFGGNMIIGGNVTVRGTADTTMASLQVGVTGAARLVTILGNISITGAGSGSIATAVMDMNTGTSGSTTIRLAGNLSIAGNGQLMGTTTVGNSNGLVLFNGTVPQTYSNTSTTFKNGIVNFTVGTGTAASKLTLLTSLNLRASNTTINKGTLTIDSLSTIDCGNNNINSIETGNAIFNLKAGTSFVTANTGGIEGTATNSSTGSIVNDVTMVRTYSPLASYEFNGSTNTPFPTAITTMSNLTIGDNTSILLNKSIELTDTLALKNAVTLDLSNANFTLKSTAAKTARVAPVPATVTVNYGGSGRFVVERYFPARRSWRLITSPLSSNGTTATIFSEWQNGGLNTAGIGTLITGPSPNILTNGLDASSNNAFSLRGFQNSIFSNIGSTLVPLSGTALSAANIGYFMFVRGDRNPLNFTIPNTNVTTLISKGKLQYGTQAFPGFTRPAADGLRYYALVGNPYASPIDFNLLTRVNLIKRFIVCDPSIGTGAFVTFDDLANTGNYVGSLPAAYSGPLDKNIQSSQAFFVETDAGVGTSSITFNESNKSRISSISMFRPATPSSAVTSSFRSILHIVNADNTTKLADGNLAEFDNIFNNAVDLQDAMKFSNVNENFALLRNNASIAMERRKPITVVDTLFFNLLRTTQRNYRFEFQPTNFDPSLIAFIEDSYLGTKTMIDLFDITTYDFSISRDVKSSAANRFRIVFSSIPLETLPVTFKTIRAYQQASDIAVEWTVENEINIATYEVEKSVDGINFSKINFTAATAANGSKTYKYVDINTVDGNNFYRIVSYSKTGATEYSRILLVKISEASGTGISIYPNPIIGNSIGVSFNNMKRGLYQLRLVNSLGQTIITSQISHIEGNGMVTLNPVSKLAAGIYQLQVIIPDKKVNKIKIIVQ